MGKIQVNPAAAREQATKLTTAASGLGVHGSPYVSGETTIQGNGKARESVENVFQATKQLQEALVRDVGTIHSMVASFVQADQTIATALNQLKDPLTIGKK